MNGARPRPDEATTVTLGELIARLGSRPSGVVMLVGAPGSGKSTLATTVHEKLGGDAAVLSYAAYRGAVTGDPADPAGDPEGGRRLYERLRQRCADGLLTIVDGTHHIEAARAAIAAIADAAMVPAIAVVLSTPLQVCLDRQLTRPGPAPGKEHGLRIPDARVRDIHHTISQAQSALAGDGFTVYTLTGDATEN